MLPSSSCLLFIILCFSVVTWLSHGYEHSVSLFNICIRVYLFYFLVACIARAKNFLFRCSYFVRVCFYSLTLLRSVLAVCLSFSLCFPFEVPSLRALSRSEE